MVLLRIFWFMRFSWMHLFVRRTVTWWPEKSGPLNDEVIYLGVLMGAHVLNLIVDVCNLRSSMKVPGKVLTWYSNPHERKWVSQHVFCNGLGVLCIGFSGLAEFPNTSSQGFWVCSQWGFRVNEFPSMFLARAWACRQRFLGVSAFPSTFCARACYASGFQV